MKTRASLTLILILLNNLLAPLSNSQAKPLLEVKLESSYRSKIVPEGQKLTNTNVKKLSEGEVSFRFAGTECVIDSLKGCRVIKSNNSIFPVGFTFSAVTKQISTSRVVPSTFSKGCSWCSFLGDTIAIVLFVYYAPVSAPAVVLVATYSVGVGIILGNA
jgi:hypothetical protein